MNKSLFLVGTFGFLLLLLTSCSSKDLAVDCPVDQLLLDHSSYPPDTIFDAIDSPIAEKPKESAGQSTYYHDSWMDEMVIRYSSVNRANEVFDERKRSIFHPNEVYGEWEVPPILNLDDLSADHYEIACGNVVSFGDRCYMIGQYNEYYVFFRADIFNDGITHELFRDLVLKIDGRMSACISQ
jgi:hypothetical protein